MRRAALSMLRYRIGASPQLLILTDRVLKHFDRHRQSKANLPEAGGQLFAKLSDGEILIEKATGPRPTDRRGRTFYNPDRRAEQREIDHFHGAGLHYIGDWHTHPCARPEPSHTDIASIMETTQRSSHDLNGFILIIVGTDPFPSGIRVSIYSQNELVLRPEDDEAIDQANREDPPPRKNWIRRLFRQGHK